MFDYDPQEPETLQSLVTAALFTDGRSGGQRGWWADSLKSRDADRFTSRLWTLRREKPTEETRMRAEEYAREALAFLIQDGFAASFDVEASWARPGVLLIAVGMDLADGGRAVVGQEFELAIAMD